MNQKWYHKYAVKHGYLIDEEAASLIHEGLEHNKELYGVRYCPCNLEHSVNTVCPCLEFRTTQNCTCGLFLID